ncbi:MAG: nitrilase-related carbon-nitrogen hydrolase [Anaerolineae bacterium]
MEKSEVTSRLGRWICLALGVAAFTFVGWRFNWALAAWIAPVLLIRFFRDYKRWYEPVIAYLALGVVTWFIFNGAWALDVWMMPVFSLLRPLPFVLALLADRWLSRRLPSFAATLVYPAVYLALDYTLAFTPFGTILSAGAGQFRLQAVTQLAAVTGIWGIVFLSGWVASAINSAWESHFNLRSAGAGVLIPAVALVVVLVGGGIRIALNRAVNPTVRVGSVSVEHPRDYWIWIDASTPRETVAAYATELRGIEDELFAASARAVAAGATIVFWSEGNAVYTQDDAPRFTARAADFARAHQIYLAAAVLELQYGSTMSDNKVLVFGPDGALLLTYVKTMSWYPTGSDGILHTVDTPYGRIGTAVCFDMDFPGFIQRFGQLKTDIVLVPAFDSQLIAPFHTEVGLYRAVENGFAIVRQVNTGSSMASDAFGNVLAYQDYFRTPDRIMLSDIPIKRVPTLYAILGDWFAWANIALVVVLVLLGVMKARRQKTRSAA